MTSLIWNKHKVQQSLHTISFSTTSSSNTNISTNTNTNTNQNSTLIPIYQRDSKRTFFPRALLSFSTLHFGYWIWYVLDFTPAVNASQMEQLYVDPNMGYVGLAMSAGMMGAAGIYPRFLISEIWYDTYKNQAKIQCFSLPFCSPKSISQFEIDNHNNNNIDKVVDLKTTTLKMDAEPKKLTNLAQNSIFPMGHTPIHIQNQTGFLLLDINDNVEYNEIVNQEKLQALLLGWSLKDASTKAMMTKGKKRDGMKHTKNHHHDVEEGLTKKQLALRKRILRRRGRN